MTRARPQTRRDRLPSFDLTAPAGPSTPRRTWTRADRVVVAGFLLLWLAVGLLPVAFSIGDLRLAAGAVGTPGTLSVTRCVSEGSYRSHTTDCDGWFAPADGGPSVAVHTTADSGEGDVRPAQLEPDEPRAVPAGPAAVVAALTPLFLTLLILAFWPLALLAALGRSGDRRRRRLGGTVAAVIGAVGVVAGLAASLP